MKGGWWTRSYRGRLEAVSSPPYDFAPAEIISRQHTVFDVGDRKAGHTGAYGDDGPGGHIVDDPIFDGEPDECVRRSRLGDELSDISAAETAYQR